MTTMQILLFIFFVVLPIFIAIIMLITKPSATEIAEIERQIAEEEEKLRQNPSYSMRGWNDQQDLRNEAIAIVKARMDNSRKNR